MTADKGWTHHFANDLRDRLRAADFRCEPIDGRAAAPAPPDEDAGVMLTSIRQLRRAVRGVVEGVVVVLPHLDVMATDQGGWTNISRELVPLLYECPGATLLGFRDPTLSLLPVVEKLFPRRFTVEQAYREANASPTGGGSPRSVPAFP